MLIYRMVILQKIHKDHRCGKIPSSSPLHVVPGCSLKYVPGWCSWLVASTPLKNIKVSWDDEVPNTWKKKKMFQTTNQSIFSSAFPICEAAAPALRATAPARWPWWCRRSATPASCRPGHGKWREKIPSYTMFIPCLYHVYTMFIPCLYHVSSSTIMVLAMVLVCVCQICVGLSPTDPTDVPSF